MNEIAMHGRGGQGVVVALRMLAQAFFEEGYEVQTFPSFGAERRGAPLVAFLRVSKEKISERCGLYQQDHLMILDKKILDSIDVNQGVKEDAFIIINCPELPSTYSNKLARYRVVTFDCNLVAKEHQLGSSQMPVVNTIMLGVFAKVTGLVRIDSVAKGIKRWLPASSEGNIRAARTAYEKAQSYSAG
jgi:2-oxoacid:acceptor oxidoreductase gamma subunit (pyruvate/2-ketoisovalerate family)